MTPETIGFLDSGIGGLPYLAHLRRRRGGGRFVYVADRENFPYGEKGREEIIAATLSLAGRLIARENPRLVVVACNTMSVVALDALRARFSLPFVGVVPAVKPAAELSRRRRVGVLATRQTVEGEYLRKLIERHANGCSVVSLSSGGLVEFVEKGTVRSSRRTSAGNGCARRWRGFAPRASMRSCSAARISSTWSRSSGFSSMPRGSRWWIPGRASRAR